MCMRTPQDLKRDSQRHRLVSIRIPIINLRPSPNRIGFIMENHVPTCGVFLVNKIPRIVLSANISRPKDFFRKCVLFKVNLIYFMFISWQKLPYSFWIEWFLIICIVFLHQCFFSTQLKLSFILFYWRLLISKIGFMLIQVSCRIILSYFISSLHVIYYRHISNSTI